MVDIVRFLESFYDEENFETFYRDIFPVGSFEEKGLFEKGKYNGIAVRVGLNDKKVKRVTITDDLEAINDLVASDDFCIMSPISYIGKSRSSKNARYLYALAIDLDGVTELSRLQYFHRQISEKPAELYGIWKMPLPTYLVASGTGIHIYYVFKRPVPLFPDVVKELEKLKKRLTWQAWTQGASSLYDNVQYESLFQGFRMVGTITKVGTRATAYKVGGKVDIEYLNQFVPKDDVANIGTYKSTLSLEEAKKKYPKWYKRRIIQKQPKGSWICHRGLYEWWRDQLPQKATEGHRYWCIMTLATYAIKCGISRKELEKDALKLRPILSDNGDTPFTNDDVIHALEAYTESYFTYPIKTIMDRTDIHIERNKRNGRTQEMHLKIARFTRDLTCSTEGRDWRAGNGRPSKQKIVQDWRKKNPNGKKADCIKKN